MTPILFKADTVNANTYGLGALADCISCEVSEERNGPYELTMKYPVSGRLFQELKVERLVKAKPNDTSTDQLFRIYRITTPLNGVVSVYAQHISYDLAGVAALPIEEQIISPARAGALVFEKTATKHNFTFETDASTPSRFRLAHPQSVRACLGGVEGSILDIWGGEYEWDNFRVIHRTHRGQQTGVVIEYGKNLTDLEHDADSTTVYTHLLPYALHTDEDGNETVISLTEVILPITDTDLVQQKTVIVDLTSNFDPDEDITEAKLRSKAQSYIVNNGLGLLEPTITVAFEPLWKMPDFVAILERLSLCDTVTIRHSQFGITARSKVVATVFDVLAEKYISITLGNAKSNLLQRVQDAASGIDDAKAKAEAAENGFKRFPKLVSDAIAKATSLITGQSGGYVVIHTDDETGMPYELLIMDSPSIETAVNVWRWNVEGLGFSSNGYNGPYETAITADGHIVADFITSGTLIANIIKAGVLQSQDGSSWWDLDTGEVHLATYVDKEEFRQSIADFDKKLEDAKDIGARNLLPNTKLMEPFKRYSSSTNSVTLDVDEEGFAVATFPAQGTSSLDNAIQSRQPIKYTAVRGQKVTISAMVRSDDAEAINSDVTHGVMLELDLCGEEEYDADGNLLEPVRTKYVRIPLFEQQLSTEWGKVTWTGVVNDDIFNGGSGDIGMETRFYVQIEDYSTKSFQMKKLKLELGAVATDWSPAPEDLYSDIDAQGDLITELSQSFADLEVRQNAITASVGEVRQATEETYNYLKEYIDTTMSQTASGLKINIVRMLEQGMDDDGNIISYKTTTGFSFDNSGLHISQTGNGNITNDLTPTGMTVKRADEEVLVADVNGVQATDVTVNNYLILGLYSRFEDYASGDDDKRTACYYTGP